MAQRIGRKFLNLKIEPIPRVFCAKFQHLLGHEKEKETKNCDSDLTIDHKTFWNAENQGSVKNELHIYGVPTCSRHKDMAVTMLDFQPSQNK